MAGPSVSNVVSKARMAGEAWAKLNGTLRERVQALIAASGGRITFVSGYRSTERQAQLYRAAVAKYGSEKAARKWVAPPGKSNHNHGNAVDLGGDLKLLARLAPQFGLHLPMSWEPWHVELLGGADNHEGHTDPPDDHQEEDTFSRNMNSLAAMFGVDLGASYDPSATADAADAAPQGGDQLSRLMAAIRKVESGGNYKAVGKPTKYGTASGGYQWLDSTWGKYKGFARAADAPAEVQEERARNDIQGLMAKYDGDLRRVAMHWHGGPNQKLWGPKTQSYADKVLGLI